MPGLSRVSKVAQQRLPRDAAVEHPLHLPAGEHCRRGTDVSSICSILPSAIQLSQAPLTLLCHSPPHSMTDSSHRCPNGYAGFVPPQHHVLEHTKGQSDRHLHRALSTPTRRIEMDSTSSPIIDAAADVAIPDRDSLCNLQTQVPYDDLLARHHLPTETASIQTMRDWMACLYPSFNIVECPSALGGTRSFETADQHEPRMVG